MRLLVVITVACALAFIDAKAEDLEHCKAATPAYKTGKLDLAIEFLTLCIDQGDLTVESLALAYHKRGYAYFEKGDFGQAAPNYAEGIRHGREDIFAYTNRGMAHWHLGKHDKARQDLERAREIDPSLPTWKEHFREFEGMF